MEFWGNTCVSYGPNNELLTWLFLEKLLRKCLTYLGQSIYCNSGLPGENLKVEIFLSKEFPTMYGY